MKIAMRWFLALTILMPYWILIAFCFGIIFPGIVCSLLAFMDIVHRCIKVLCMDMTEVDKADNYLEMKEDLLFVFLIFILPYRIFTSFIRTGSLSEKYVR